MMWDDLPVVRKQIPEDIPPPTRAFLSQFNRSFTPPALINDPFVVDRKFTISPLLVSRPAFMSRNPYAVDPAVARMRHYVGFEDFTETDLKPSPKLPPFVRDDEWSFDDEIWDLDDDDTVVPSII
jgi:hypothetical protein